MTMNYMDLNPAEQASAIGVQGGLNPFIDFASPSQSKDERLLNYLNQSVGPDTPMGRSLTTAELSDFLNNNVWPEQTTDAQSNYLNRIVQQFLAAEAGTSLGMGRFESDDYSPAFAKPREQTGTETGSPGTILPGSGKGVITGENFNVQGPGREDPYEATPKAQEVGRLPTEYTGTAAAPALDPFFDPRVYRDWEREERSRTPGDRTADYRALSSITPQVFGAPVPVQEYVREVLAPSASAQYALADTPAQLGGAQGMAGLEDLTFMDFIEGPATGVRWDPDTGTYAPGTTPAGTPMGQVRSPWSPERFQSRFGAMDLGQFGWNPNTGWYGGGTPTGDPDTGYVAAMDPSAGRTWLETMSWDQAQELMNQAAMAAAAPSARYATQRGLAQALSKARLRTPDMPAGRAFQRFASEYAQDPRFMPGVNFFDFADEYAPDVQVV